MVFTTSDDAQMKASGEGTSLEHMLTEASQLLSGMSRGAGLVLTAKSEAALKHIEFIQLEPTKALAVLVSQNGDVENRIIELPAGITVSQLHEASNFLNAHIRGRTLAEARAAIERRKEETRAALDTLSQDAVRKAFPDVGDADFARSVPADIARSRIERLRGGAEMSGFLRMLTEIAPTLGATTTRIQTRGMEFRNGTLELALHAPDVAALDAVRERLAALPGLKVSVTAANPGDGGIDGRIRIGGDAGGAR